MALNSLYFNVLTQSFIDKHTLWSSKHLVLCNSIFHGLWSVVIRKHIYYSHFGNSFHHVTHNAAWRDVLRCVQKQKLSTSRRPPTRRSVKTPSSASWRTSKKQRSCSHTSVSSDQWASTVECRHLMTCGPSSSPTSTAPVKSGKLRHQKKSFQGKITCISYVLFDNWNTSHWYWGRSGISWTTCKTDRQTMPALYHPIFRHRMLS